MKWTLSILGILLFTSISAQEIDRPKLIVGVVVDQMRYDYLDKFWNDFEDDGFKRLVSQGFYCRNVNYNYKPTYTGPGHASIFTGVSPAVHGIVGNNWYSRLENKVVYCVEQTNEDGSSFYSPERMQSESLADQIKQFTNFQGKSYGLSLKDRGAILPAGHLADGAYWFDGKSGKWISSEYYSHSSPMWLTTFNQKDLKESYLKEGWSLTLPLSNFEESLPDENNFERTFRGIEKATFPYDLVELQKENGWNLLKGIPQGNQMLADLAKEVLVGEKLGKDDKIDFLSVSFSATDYVGHRFGVQSVEVQDTYLKLDKTLADFLNSLDEQVGKGNYLLFLTSDHGAAMPRSYLKEKKLPNGDLDTKRMEAMLDSSLDVKFGKEDWIASFINLNVYFNPILHSTYLDQKEEIVEYSKMILYSFQGVFKVVDEVEMNSTADHLTRITANGYLRNSSGELIVIEKPGWNNYYDKGSTHGSPYKYDTHVPLIFFGAGIPAGESYRNYSIIDIAPTVSAIGGFTMPNAAQGKIILELSNQKK